MLNLTVLICFDLVLVHGLLFLSYFCIKGLRKDLRVLEKDHTRLNNRSVDHATSFIGVLTRLKNLELRSWIQGVIE